MVTPGIKPEVATIPSAPVASGRRTGTGIGADEPAVHAFVSYLVAHPAEKPVSRWLAGWLAGWHERSGYPTLAPNLSELFCRANSGRSVCVACCVRPAALLRSAKGYIC